MDDLKQRLANVRINVDAIKIIKEKFEKRGYQKTKTGAHEYQRDLEKEIPGINKWVLSWNKDTGREIEDIIMDEFRIAGDE